MTPGTVAALTGVAILIGALIGLYLVVHDLRRQLAEEGRRATHYLDEYLKARREATAEIGGLAAKVAAADTRRDSAEARLGELELELGRRRAGPLEGQTVIVNTPRPDDQSIRGVVRQELEGRRLLLGGAEYLDPDSGDVHSRPGDVVVAYSWVQILQPEA